MKPSELKNLIKTAMKEAIQEELKDILLEAVRSNKQPITESYRVSDDRTLSFNTNAIPHQPTKSPVNNKKAYLDILGEMSQPAKSNFEGEFKIPSNIDPVNGTLPDGQLGLDAIMNLIKK
jgi:hypothetical protein